MSALPKVRVPRAWKKERIEATHYLSINTGTDARGHVEIPQFGSGWRPVKLEKLGNKWAHVVECSTGTRAKVELSLWKRLVRAGREL